MSSLFNNEPAYEEKEILKDISQVEKLFTTMSTKNILQDEEIEIIQDNYDKNIDKKFHI